MQATKLSICTVALVFALCFVVDITQAKKKSDIIVVGGEEGCGPQLFLKTGGKKKENDILIMNPCKKKETKYIPFPIYESHEYDNHGYGGQGYGHDSGYDMGSHGYDQGGY